MPGDEARSPSRRWIPGWIAALVGFQRRLGDRARPVAVKQRQRVLMVNAAMAAVLFLVSVTMR